MNEQVDGNGMPEAPLEPGFDDDIDISNKGQRIVLILVAIVILAAAGGLFIMMTKKQAQKQDLDDLLTEFNTAHNSSYIPFWKTLEIDLDRIKTNADLQARLSEILSVSSVKFAEHIKEAGIPKLNEALPNYRALEARKLVLPELQATTYALEQLRDTWREFSDQVLMYEQYIKNRNKLDKLAGSWMGAQQAPKDDTKKKDAARYLKISNCILGIKDQSVIEHDPWDLSHRLRDTCAIGAEKAAWFRKVAFECLDAAEGDVEVDAIYEETIAAYGKIELDNQDTKSVFAIKECLDKSRTEFESELSNNVAAAWMEYGAKKNALINAIKEAKEAI